MRSDVAADVARLTGHAALGITRTVRRTQEAVTDATYEALEATVGPAVTPLGRVQRGVVRGIYGCVELGLMAGSAVAGHVAARRASEPAPHATGLAKRGTDPASYATEPLPHATAASEPVAPSPAHRFTLGALNAIVGDRLQDQGSTLALTMTLRSAGRDVDPTEDGLRAAYGPGDRRLAVFVHGLMEDETCWTYRGQHHHGDPQMSLPTRLQAEHGYTPLYIRYNTGLSLATNGASLARILGAVVEGWPGLVEELILVGHSMGGMVIAAALLEGGAEGQRGGYAEEGTAWAARVSRVLTLGSPSEGAPLEHLAAAVSRASESWPPALWLGDVIGLRSQGIVDLGRALGPRPYGEHTRHLAVYGALSPWPHPVTDRFGDGMVPVPAGARNKNSARDVTGTRAATRAWSATTESVVLPGLTHQGLLNHPRVHEAVTDWLAS